VVRVVEGYDAVRDACNPHTVSEDVYGRGAVPDFVTVGNVIRGFFTVVFFDALAIVRIGVIDTRIAVG
jgi:hypothetical protein